MSTQVEIGRDEHGDVKLTYTILGGHDVMRWCYHMLHGQVEFCRDASTILQRLRRWWGAKAFDRYDQTLTGGRMKRYSIRPRNQGV